MSIFITDTYVGTVNKLGLWPAVQEEHHFSSNNQTPTTRISGNRLWMKTLMNIFEFPCCIYMLTILSLSASSPHWLAFYIF